MKKLWRLLHIWTRAPRLDDWEAFVEKFKTPKHEVNIAIVGKYVDLTESYKSLNEALYHGGVANDCRSNLLFVDSETIDADTCSGILSRGGRYPGTRGIRFKGHRRQNLCG